MTKTSRRREILTKALHLFLRQFALSPEIRQARQIRRSIGKSFTQSGRLAGRKVLIPTMRDWSAHVHLEALLGHYLGSEGAIVRHISCGGGLEICDRANSWESPPMPCKSCSKYVKHSLQAHGANVSWLKDSWGARDWPEIDSMSLLELSTVSHNSYELGRIVDVPVKWFLLAETMVEDPLAAQTYRAFLRSARRVLEAVEREIARDRPDQVVLLNGLFMFEAVIWEVCRRHSIPVVSYERAFIVDSFVFAHDRVSSYYEIDEVWSQAKSTGLSPTQSRELDTYLGDRRAGLRTSDDYWSNVSDEEIELNSRGRTAVLFTNLVWDSAVLGQDLAFSSIVDWVVAAVRRFEMYPEDELIIRIHPAETKLSGRESRERIGTALARRIPVLPANVRVVPAEDDTSSYVLMEKADFGLVYSSTTGLEMVLVGKPVVVAARTHYRGKGFTIDVSSSAEFDSTIDRLLSAPAVGPPEIELARRYAHLFFFRTPYFGLGVTEPMRGLVKFDSASFVQLRNGGRGDVERFLEATTTGNSYNLGGV